MSSLSAFKTLIHQRCGLHLEGLAETRLITALASFYEKADTSDAQILLARFMQDQDLFDQLISQLTVNETYFYREPDAIEWLTDTYLPQRLAEKGGPLHIFSAGCSSGEEPYSMAMALFERYGERAKQLFRITGGDLDQQVLRKAQTGIYSGMSFRALPPRLKKRYFTPLGRHFQLSEPLLHWVSFKACNLLEVMVHDIGGPFDVILFRNVSIYFDEATRCAIQQRLKQLLTPQGILLCGVTETLGNDLGILELAEAQGVFYFHHFHAKTKAKVASNTDHVVYESLSNTGLANDAALDVDATLTNDSKPASASSALAPETTGALESLEEQLQLAHTLLNQNAFSEAAQLLEQLLKQQPWCVDGLLLAGLVARWQQQPQQAHDYFKRAIYVAPECWPAHFYQAELLRLGELPDAPGQRRRGYAATIRLLEASPDADGGLQSISPPLSPGDACFLAKRHLKALSNT